MSVEDAMLKYHQKQLDELQGNKVPTKKNKKPEKLVEKQVLAWAKKNDFHFHVIEAKASYNPATGDYTSQSVVAGFPDIVGNKQHYALYVELKAPGKLSTLRPRQRDFLTAKINQGAFAVCVDSISMLSSLWTVWVNTTPRADRTKYLLNRLPKEPKQRDQGGLFDE